MIRGGSVFCNFSTAHITPGDCCHSGDGLEPAGEVVDDRYSDSRSDFGYLYARIVEDDPLGFFDTEGIEPLMKVCSQYMVEVKREIVAVDADVFCEGFDGDSRGAVEFVFNPILECDGYLFFFVSELYFSFRCPPHFSMAISVGVGISEAREVVQR